MKENETGLNFSRNAVTYLLKCSHNGRKEKQDRKKAKCLTVNTNL